MSKPGDDDADSEPPTVEAPAALVDSPELEAADVVCPTDVGCDEEGEPA